MEMAGWRYRTTIISVITMTNFSSFVILVKMLNSGNYDLSGHYHGQLEGLRQSVEHPLFNDYGHSPCFAHIICIPLFVSRTISTSPINGTPKNPKKHFQEKEKGTAITENDNNDDGRLSLSDARSVVGVATN